MNIVLLYLQLILTTIFTATACCIPGTFLIVRGTSLISDAISHAIFLGIVLSYLLYGHFYSPVLFLGATITALSTIWIIERIIKTKRLFADAVIGIMFPFLFSIAVILINKYARSTHLDIDAVLLGELAFSPFYQINCGGIMIGSYAMWTMFIILLINLCMLFVFYRKLVTSSFDPDFASIIKHRPDNVYWILMTTACITILGAFEAAGAILVVAFIITPPATAYLITRKINEMLAIGMLISIFGALFGCLMANALQISIAGSIATVYSMLFAVAYIAKRLNFKTA